jgi:hypothetical protein
MRARLWPAGVTNRFESNSSGRLVRRYFIIVIISMVIHELYETVTYALDATAPEPGTTVDAVNMPSCSPAASNTHYSEGNVKMLATLEEEACKRFPFNSVFPDSKHLKIAVREWSESVGASITLQGSAIKCSRSHAPDGCEKRKEKRRVKNGHQGEATRNKKFTLRLQICN